MSDLNYFEERKKELIARFNSADNDIKVHKKAIEQLSIIQYELKGSYEECEKSIAKIKEFSIKIEEENNVEINNEAA